MRFGYRFKISATFLLLSTVGTGILFTALYFQAIQDRTAKIRTDLEKTAFLGASSLDATRLKQIPIPAGCETDPYFSELINSLRQIKSSDPYIDDVYVLVPFNKQTFQWLGNANRGTGPTVTCGESYDVSKIPALRDALEHASADQYVIGDKWGLWISGYAPIRDAQGNTIAVLGIDMADKVFRSLRSNFVKNYVVTLLVVLLFSLIIGFISSKYLSKPLASIVHGMEKVRSGDLDYQLSITSGDEFEKIAANFNNMTHCLKDNIEKLQVATREKERINRELEIAAELQRRALPKFAPTIAGVEIAADSIPAREVGGDYFDFVTSQKGQVGFVIADAAGKGLPGSIFMTNSRSAFKVISRDESSPSRTLSRTNQHVSMDAAESGSFITFFYGMYDIAAKRFLYANAGHNPQLLFRKNLENGFQLLGAQATPIGIMEEENFPEESLQLQKDDVLVMYTDGVTEATDTKGKMFELQRLVDIVRPNTGKSASQILSVIKNELASFTGSEPQFDDITLIIAKIA